MPSSIHQPAPASKVTRYRARLRAAGLRPVQYWVPDTRSPGFAELLREQCRRLREDPAESDILSFTEYAAAYAEGWR
ncbi:MAG: hypothetical protein Fur0019_04640 [Tibeticola sp.]